MDEPIPVDLRIYPDDWWCRICRGPCFTCKMDRHDPRCGICHHAHPPHEGHSGVAYGPCGECGRQVATN